MARNKKTNRENPANRSSPGIIDRGADKHVKNKKSQTPEKEIKTKQIKEEFKKEFKRAFHNVVAQSAA